MYSYIFFYYVSQKILWYFSKLGNVFNADLSLITASGRSKVTRSFHTEPSSRRSSVLYNPPLYRRIVTTKLQRTVRRHSTPLPRRYTAIYHRRSQTSSPDVQNENCTLSFARVALLGTTRVAFLFARRLLPRVGRKRVSREQHNFQKKPKTQTTFHPSNRGRNTRKPQTMATTVTPGTGIITERR